MNSMQSGQVIRMIRKWMFTIAVWALGGAIHSETICGIAYGLQFALIFSFPSYGQPEETGNTL